MLIALRSVVRQPWTGRIAVVPIIAAISFLAQSAAGPFMPATFAAPAAAPASPASAHESDQAQCPPSANIDIPFGSTIQAKVMGLLDSGQLKAGKGIWVTVVNGLAFPGCTLNAGSALYGHVTAAAAQKNPDSSELSLVLDHADCEGHAKKEMQLRLIGLVGPPDEWARDRDPAPGGLHGSRKSTPAAKAALDSGDQLNPGGPPHTVHPGIVVGLPNVKLELEGGPACSDRIFSTNHSVQLDPGSELILVMQIAP